MAFNLGKGSDIIIRILDKNEIFFLNTNHQLKNGHSQGEIPAAALKIILQLQ